MYHPTYNIHELVGATTLKKNTAAHAAATTNYHRLAILPEPPTRTMAKDEDIIQTHRCTACKRAQLCHARMLGKMLTWQLTKHLTAPNRTTFRSSACMVLNLLSD